ncbi:MAG: hypothetical protein GC171_14020 [Terrimonas sp.]|nr:hypothetical protein [Terrimonas sp.]
MFTIQNKPASRTKHYPNDSLLAFLLTLPVFLFVLLYYLKSGNGLIAPGFLQYDNISYIAYARQYPDSGFQHLLYSNPFNDSAQYPALYFQVQNFLFLAFLYLGVPPGVTLIVFTLLFAFITFRIIIALYDQLMPESKNRVLSILLFSWGGGLLVTAGLGALSFIPIGGLDKIDRLFVLDPGWGWWGLNLGRSLLFSTEAYYHALFLGGILSILKRKWVLAIFLSFLLFLSHPYTGIEYLSIIVAWCGYEIILKKNRAIPAWFALANLMILVLHIGYYMVWLNRFPDHHSVHEQCAMNLSMRYSTLIPAYILTGCLAIGALFTKGGIKPFLNKEYNRLFLTWFLISFLLANHEIFMKPLEPVHFTRGYVWTSLFILGLPFLEQIWGYLRQKKKAALWISILLFIFLSDNAAWLANYGRKGSSTGLSVYLNKDQQAVLDWLKNNTDTSTLIISNDNLISILSTVYTKAYPWISHNLATPFLSQKKDIYYHYIKNGVIDRAWGGRNFIFILNHEEGLENNRIQHPGFIPDKTVRIGMFSLLIKRNLTRKESS